MATKAKLDLSAIMRAAWTETRSRRTFNGKFCFCRKAFSQALKNAWFEAKQAAGALTAVEVVKADRMEAIRGQIEMLSYKSLRYDISAQRRQLEAELSALAA